MRTRKAKKVRQPLSHPTQTPSQDYGKGPHDKKRQKLFLLGWLRKRHLPKCLDRLAPKSSPLKAKRHSMRSIKHGQATSWWNSVRGPRGKDSLAMLFGPLLVSVPQFVGRSPKRLTNCVTSTNSSPSNRSPPRLILLWSEALRQGLCVKANSREQKMATVTLYLANADALLSKGHLRRA